MSHSSAEPGKLSSSILSVKKSPEISLWVESPCTIAFCSKLPPLEQSKRFHFNSIYYRDDPCKPSRKIDEFQKPDLLLSDFRRQIN